MKIFKVDFYPEWPVPCGLVIAANDWEEAEKIAKATIKHTAPISIEEVDISSPCVVFYESGNY
jgi:hypothetical protein